MAAPVSLITTVEATVALEIHAAPLQTAQTIKCSRGSGGSSSGRSSASSYACVWL